ncbi:MAG: glycerol kinase GlpK [Acidobacteriota bacterium]|nr:glycerol kinase GlpK [Acidobacteriota bacterium]MDH3531205.1 glycerol kinase GlpK [Acidobacteriota bacterium]
MEKQYILALDQGTTSSRAIVFDRDSRAVSMAQREFRQIYPEAGRVEHDPEEIWRSQLETALEALSNASIGSTEIAAIGITNQRETTLVWERKTGKPVCNAIVWQDRRTSAFCDQIRGTDGEWIRAKTGLESDAYFSASKIRWILRNVEGAAESAQNGDLCFGTVDTWLIWNLSNGRLHITDVSNASRTMLFDIESLEWSPELLDLFGVPAQMLPEVRSSCEVYGEVSDVSGLDGIPIAGLAGDQQAALFGQVCLRPGETKNTYGTGCFTLQNTGAHPAVSHNRLLTTVAWKIDGATTYALEGSVFIGGAVIQWLRDALGVIDSSDEVEALSNSVADNGGVYFVPAFAGLGTPYWDQDARGTIIGLTRGTGAAHIARAAIESIAFQTAELLEAIRNDSGERLSELRVDGGATANRSLLQFQADILGLPVVVSGTPETTALGAAYLAGLAVGYWKGTEDLADHWHEKERYEPSISTSDAERQMGRWREAVGRSRNWA